MFEPFQKFISKAANQYGLSRQIKAAEVCQNFRTSLPKFFKNEVLASENITPAHFKSGTLTIEVENTAWAQEVIMRKEKIIKELNAKAGQKVIQNLRTQLRNNEDSGII